MGKGAGCGGSKPSVIEPTAPKVSPHPASKAEALPAVPPPATQHDTGHAAVPLNQCNIAVVFYSMYGHVEGLARTVKEGIDTVPGCSATLFQVAEILPQEVLESMHAPPKSDCPIITPEQLATMDAVVFGFPTRRLLDMRHPAQYMSHARFGMMCSQMKTFFDMTGTLWQNGALVGTPVTAFTSTGSQGGGQETTLMTAATQFAAHGMIYVPPGYSLGGALFSNDESRGGTPWGCGTLAGADGSQQPSAVELAAARHQGTYFAGKALKLTA